jgi:hypothetical protein
MEQEILTFSKSNEQQIRNIFNLKEDLTKSLLLDWQNKAEQMEISAAEQQVIDKLFHKIKYHGRGWNKAEKKLKLVSVLVELVDFDNLELDIRARYDYFLEADYGKLKLEGKVDIAVISEFPHLLLNISEYDEASDNDSVGELLAALLSVQKYGQNPVYGIYVLRQMWFFVILKNQQYSISKAFLTDRKAHLDDIFKMLKAQKEMIFEVV